MNTKMPKPGPLNSAEHYERLKRQAQHTGFGQTNYTVRGLQGKKFVINIENTNRGNTKLTRVSRLRRGGSNSDEHRGNSLMPDPLKSEWRSAQVRGLREGGPNKAERNFPCSPTRRPHTQSGEVCRLLRDPGNWLESILKSREHDSSGSQPLLSALGSNSLEAQRPSTAAPCANSMRSSSVQDFRLGRSIRLDIGVIGTSCLSRSVASGQSEGSISVILTDRSTSSSESSLYTGTN